MTTTRQLVLGHEMLGVVEQDGRGFTKGDLVSATVRRSCHHCLACDEGAPDSCLTGDYSERGITRLDGFARELVVEDPTQLIAIPRSLGRLGVLAEPTSICARGIRHALTIGNRAAVAADARARRRRRRRRASDDDPVAAPWLRRLGRVARAVERDRRAVGAHYVQTKGEDDLAELAPFDLVFEAAGDAQLMANALGLLGRSGVACLLGIDGRDEKVEIPGSVIGVDTVLENRVLFGSVNAQMQDWLAGVEALDRARERWPGALEQLVGLRVPLDRFEEAFAFTGGKATLVLDASGAAVRGRAFRLRARPRPRRPSRRRRSP